ncbi:MAG: alpha/beta hydrolase [Gammaproteobacteria bacterium]|nr:alpha/beta hydrolase [Gammaproteobacteria bacterium]
MSLPASDEKLLITGPAGQLELLCTMPATIASHQAVVIICHPHPLYGGSMTNKVVHMLAKGANELGLVNVRFNFRGVAGSEGQFDDARGESEDLLAVVDWVRNQFPDSPIWLAGFSFGAYIAIKNYSLAGAERLLMVAPPATLYDLSEIRSIDVPCWILQGGQDEVIDPDVVRDWITGLSPAPNLQWIESAGHFFHGQLSVVRDFITSAWQN